MPKGRLRIHLVGSDTESKRELAAGLRRCMNRELGRTLVVMDMQRMTLNRLNTSQKTHTYFLSLESDYMSYEVGIKTKTHHLIFVDSLVDRFHRTHEAKINLELYFAPRFEASKPGHLFVYGPNIDDDRSSIIGKFDLPVQVWSTKEKAIDSILTAASLRLGHLYYGRIRQ